MICRFAVIAVLMVPSWGREAAANCIESSDYQRVPLILKYQTKILLTLQKILELRMLSSADAFIINFGYQKIHQSSVDKKNVNSSARVVVSGANGV